MKGYEVEFRENQETIFTDDPPLLSDMEHKIENVLLKFDVEALWYRVRVSNW